jgi:hypothetical protein
MHRCHLTFEGMTMLYFDAEVLQNARLVYGSLRISLYFCSINQPKKHDENDCGFGTGRIGRI